MYLNNLISTLKKCSKEHAKVIKRIYGNMYLLVGPALDKEDFKTQMLDLKILEIYPKNKTSYHYHKITESFFLVLKGRIKARINDELYFLSEGKYVFVRNNIKHQFINDGTDIVYLIEIMVPPYRQRDKIWSEKGGANNE